MLMWHPPFGPGAGGSPEFNVGTTRYAADFVGEVEVAERDAPAARQSGYVVVDHPQAVAFRQARGARG